MGTYKLTECISCHCEFMAPAWANVCEDCANDLGMKPSHWVTKIRKQRPLYHVNWPLVIIGNLMMICGAMLMGYTIGSGLPSVMDQKCGKTPVKHPTKFETTLPVVDGGGVRG